MLLFTRQNFRSKNKNYISYKVKNKNKLNIIMFKSNKKTNPEELKELIESLLKEKLETCIEEKIKQLEDRIGPENSNSEEDSEGGGKGDRKNEDQILLKEQVMTPVRSDFSDQIEPCLHTLSTNLEELGKKLSSIDLSLSNISVDVKEKLIENEKLEDLLISKNEIIQSYQQDVYKKLTSPFIKQFIALADMMTILLTDEENKNKDVVFWEKQFEQIIKSILFILKDFSVNNYSEAKQGDLFDPNRQEVISTKETGDESLDKKIYRSVNTGFIWELPYILKPKQNGEAHLQKVYEFIIRKEQVETYKLKK